MKLKWLFLAVLVISLFIVPNYVYSQGMGGSGNNFIKKFSDLRNSFFIEQKEKSEKQPMEHGKIVTDSFRDFVIVEYTDFKNRNGYSLYGTVFMPREAYENMQKGISDKKYPTITIAYGTMCVNRMYGILYRELAKKGYIVEGLDYQGQGFSSGPAQKTQNSLLGIRGRVDGEAMADDVLRFRDYLIDNGYPIDVDKMGIWGWSLGTMVSPAVVAKDPRYKAMSHMGFVYDNAELGSPTHLGNYIDTVKVPLQIEMTQLALHDDLPITPWYDAAVRVFDDYKGPIVISIHDPLPYTPITMAGFMFNKSRTYHYILEDVIPFFDYFVKGDKSAYNKIIAPDKYCNDIGKVYRLGKDVRDFTLEEKKRINQVINRRIPIDDGAWFSNYVFLPVWSRVVVPMLPYTDQIMELMFKTFLPWNVAWDFAMEYVEPNNEAMNK